MEQHQVRREVKELLVLFEISQILDTSLDMRKVVGPVLDTIAQHMGMMRGTLTLLNRQTREIFIEAAHGLSTNQQERGKYQLGEGITGQVIASGNPAIIPIIAEEPHFLNKTRARKDLHKKDISFICVPIKIGNEVIGALSVDKLFEETVSFEEDVRLLTIIASMIANAVKLRQTASEERQQLMEENLKLHQRLKDRFQPENIIGKSKAMQLVYDQIEQVAKTNTTILIRGESGTGKELVAQAIHYNSKRSEKPFIKVNCAALPESIIESELFGHEKGSFTGALNQRKGRFELANGGTIFLDEIGDLSIATQVKLLRVLQEKEFERVGGVETIKTDVRIITATNRNLEELIENNQFRQDLYYRLNVFPIHIPPLRKRKADIMLLSDYFVEKYSQTNHKSVKRISTPAIDMLMCYHWPGNVRELENCIERAVILSNDEVIHAHHLPPSLQTAEASGTTHKGDLTTSLAELEQELIIDSLKQTGGNMSKAAAILGITERIMGLRIKKYKLNLKQFRAGKGQFFK